jgi:hypothetical protein
MKSILSAISLIVAAGVTITALLLPPQGEIDASVLYVVAQFLIFAGTLLGVESAAEKILRMIRLAKK